MKFNELIELKVIEPFMKSLKPDEIVNSFKDFDNKKHKLIYGSGKPYRLPDNTFRPEIKDLGVLEMINGGCDFGKDSNVENLGNLRVINGYADFRNSKLKSLGNITTIGQYIFLGSIEDLGSLKSVGNEFIGDYKGYNPSPFYMKNFGKLTNVLGEVTIDDKIIQDKLYDHLNKMNEVFFVKKRLHYLHDSTGSPLRIIGKVDSWDMSEINILLNDNWLGIVKNTMALERFFPEVSQINEKILNLGKIKIDYKGKIKVLENTFPQ